MKYNKTHWYNNKVSVKEVNPVAQKQISVVKMKVIVIQTSNVKMAWFAVIAIAIKKLDFNGTAMTIVVWHQQQVNL